MPINPSSYNALFLSEQSLKDASLIDQNVDMKTLLPTIKFVQDIHLTRLLGSGLFADLQNKIVSSSLNSNETFLLNAYIEPVMIWYVTQESYLLTTYKMKNKGVQVQSADNSQAASMSDLEVLADKAQQKADWYGQRLINYLIANAGLYPAYRLIRTYDDVPPTNRGYNSRIYLGRPGFPDYDNYPAGSTNVSGSN